MAGTATTGGASTGFTLNRRIGAAKSKEITTVENFDVGYRNREDISLLKPQTLVPGSFNVLTSITGRVGSRMGYTIDGAASTLVSPIRAPYDWETGTGTIQHLRASFADSALTNGEVQLRFVNPGTGVVSWIPIISLQPSIYYQYAPYWDTTALREKLLFVNRTGYIWEWNGATTSVSSSTATSITTNGTKTWGQLGFYGAYSSYGDATTEYTVTYATGTSTATYTFNSTGTNPVITSAKSPVGTTIVLNDVLYNGTFVISAVGSNTFSFVSLINMSTGTNVKSIPQYDYNYNGGQGYLVTNGATSYTYLGGANTTTLIGVSPSAAGIVANSLIFQNPTGTQFKNYTFTGTPSPSINFTADLICQLRTTNQILVASISSNVVYLSKAGNYQDYSQSTARVQYEGDMFTAVGSINSMINQDADVYISAGVDEWYVTDFVDTTITDSTTGTTTTFENSELQQLKTTSQQAAISQYATTKIANEITFISFEPRLDSLGLTKDFLTVPQITDLSYPIFNDMNAYNFTDAWVAYNKQFVYMGVPQMGLFRMYNMTNPKNPYWEAPQNISLSGLSFIGNTIIGHSYQTSESYIMNNGWSDRALSVNQTGLPISAQAVFAFQEDGLRAKRKSFNRFFLEGYMSTGTNITVSLFGRSPNPGLAPQVSFIFAGTDPRVLTFDNSSIGLNSLGKNPLAGSTEIIQQGTFNPYFAAINTFVRFPYLAYQPAFSSYGVNQQWSLLSYGNNASPTSENETDLVDNFVPTGTIWSEDNQPWNQASPWAQ